FHVTGVQTCALPISPEAGGVLQGEPLTDRLHAGPGVPPSRPIPGRRSRRGRRGSASSRRRGFPAPPGERAEAAPATAGASARRGRRAAIITAPAGPRKGPDRPRAATGGAARGGGRARARDYRPPATAEGKTSR